MALGDWLPKLRGTMSSLFQLGKAGPNIRNNGGAIEARNNANSAFALLRALDPVAANDLVTLGYFNANNAAAVDVAVATMPLAQVTKISTASLPNNAQIVATVLVVTTAYDGVTPTFNIIRTGDATKNPLGTPDSDLATIGTYGSYDMVTNWGSTGLGTVTATFAGTGVTVGAAVLYIFYATPVDIS